jgi:RNA polymerase sigma factor (sigma-70 family)
LAVTNPSTSQLQGYLDGLRPDDAGARQAVLQNSQERLRLLTRRMLRDYPGVRRWEETDDVLQNVLIRLDRMLQDIPVSSVKDYLRLASTQIRRELIDLARHYQGPAGIGANYATPAPQGAGEPERRPPEGEADSSGNPEKLARWSELHRQVAALPDEECEVFDLLWYQGLTQKEAAALLCVSLNTVKRRWQSARLNLVKSLGGELPF